MPSRPARISRFIVIWTRRAMTLVIVLAALVLAGLVGFWILGGGVVAERSARLANGLFLDENSRVTIGRVEGFPLSRLVLKDLRVETREAQGWRPVLFAREVELRYDPWGLLHRRYEVSRIQLTDPEIHLLRRETGGYAIPGFRGSGGSGSGGSVPEFRLRRLLVAGGRAEIDLPWRRLQVDSLVIDADARSEKGSILIGVNRVAGILADSLGALDLEAASIRVDLPAGDAGEAGRVGFEGLRGRWDGASFALDGSVSPGRFGFRFEGEGIPLWRVGRLLGRSDLDPGTVELVKGTVEREGDAVRFAWTGAGRWEPWRAESLRGTGTLRGGVLRLEEVSARSGDLTLEDVALVLPLQESRMEVSGRFEKLRLEDLPIEAASGIPGLLSGRVEAVLADRTDIARGLTAHALLDAGHLYGLAFRQVELSVSGADSFWTADSLRAELEGASLEAEGDFGPAALDLRLRYRGDIRPLRPFVKNETLAGEAGIEATLTGTLRRPVLMASGFGLGLEIESISVPRLDLVRAEGPLLEDRDLVLDLVAAQGLSLPGMSFDRAQAYLSVTGDEVVVTELEAARGDTLLSAAGRLRWEPAVAIDLDRAELRSQGRRLWIETLGKFVWEEERLTARELVIHTTRGSLEAEGVFEPETRDLDARFTFHRLDPSVFFPPDEPPPVRIGSVSGTAHVLGAFPDLEGETDLELKAIEWEKGRLDSARAQITLEGREATIEDLSGWAEGGAVLVRGRIRLPGTLQETLEAAAVGPDFPADSLAFDLTGSLSNIQLARWLSFLPRPDRPGGRVDAEIALSGTAASPRIALRGEGLDLGWHNFVAQGLTAALRFEDGTLRIDALTVQQGGRRTEVRGSGPLDLTLHPFHWALPERELDLRVEAEDGSPDVLRLLPWIRDASGTFHASLSMTGTPKQPIVDGEASLEGGRILIRDRDEIVEEVSARVTVTRNLLTIERAEGLLGDGRVRAEGTYRLWVAETEAYALRLIADRAVVRDEGLYAARVSGTLTLRPLRARDGRIYPYAEGSLFVHRAEYAGSLEPQDIATFRPRPILYQVSIEAPSQVLVRNEQVDAELGGELEIRQEVDRISVLGELEILRGTYQLFLEQFRITEGTLSWNDPDSVVPEMDVTAEATVPPYVIVVALNGRADKPVVESSALLLDGRIDAGLTESEVFQVLAAGSVGLGAGTVGLGTGTSGAGAGSTSSEALASGMAAGTTLLGGRIEQEVLRRVGLVDEFDIDSDRGRTGDFALTLGVRKWLTPALSVAYRQGLSQNFEQDVAVEYRLRRAIFLRAGYARRQTTSLATGLAQEYNLDLRLRHEY